eukprot:CAMPEP_0197489874 /NCGR_PEP_ID=MMETSP1311-20131121/4566_1 /TAXON_ID=464262 /ORGANISM="Genus nov. species nov., Strain RCC856" /LENGTH=84 /DNA_ID=CAMNT_0043034281 /DNA_START=68 /DNA_END=322 /DNA_ORIENTATION=-
MPVNQWSVGLCAAGTLLVATTRVAFRRKADAPFRFAYFFSWPVLGTGLIWLAQPENENMVETLYRNGHIDKAKYDELKAKHDRT